MNYFKSISQDDLVQMIKNTKSELFLCLPSFHEEVAKAISCLSDESLHNNKTIGIHLLVDFDPQTFRQGYGAIDAVTNIIKKNIEVKTLKDNRISFIISDNIGFYLFIESRSQIPADKETINAVKIDPISMVRIKKFFFTSSVNNDFKDELSNAVIEEGLLLKNANELLNDQIALVEDLSRERVNEVLDDLKRNPPLNPDFKRIVEIYSNKFQYVKLQFEGANLKNRKIKLPSKALPIADANLKKRLETKLNLFSQVSGKDSFTALNELNERYTEIRGKYLKKVKSRVESLLNKTDKENFIEEIEIFKKSVNEAKKVNLTDIANRILETKEQLLKDLEDFFVSNPKSLFQDDADFWAQDVVYITQVAKKRAQEVVHRLKWPEAHELLNGFKVDLQFSDITFEDLKSKMFVQELKEHNLIDVADANQLAEFSKGVKTV